MSVEIICFVEKRKNNSNDFEPIKLYYDKGDKSISKPVNFFFCGREKWTKLRQMREIKRMTSKEEIKDKYIELGLYDPDDDDINDISYNNTYFYTTSYANIKYLALKQTLDEKHKKENNNEDDEDYEDDIDWNYIEKMVSSMIELSEDNYLCSDDIRLTMFISY